MYELPREGMEASRGFNHNEVKPPKKESQLPIWGMKDIYIISEIICIKFCTAAGTRFYHSNELQTGRWQK
jgi:hypothetical protein